MALDRAWDGTDAVYMSFDIDCIEARATFSNSGRAREARLPTSTPQPHPASPSTAQAGFVPGTGWPEPGGFLPREALKMVGLVAAEGLCGMEIVEVRAQHANPTGEEPATRRRPHSRTHTARVPSCPCSRAGEPAVRPRRHHVADGAPRLRRRPRLDGGARQDGAPQEHHRQALRALLIFPTTAPPVTCMPSLRANSHHSTLEHGLLPSRLLTSTFTSPSYGVRMPEFQS